MIKNLILFLVLLLGSCCEEHIEECPCFTEHQNPIYKGCESGIVYDSSNNCSVQGLISQIYSVLKYPQEAIMDSIQGTVAISFDIFEDGSIGNYAVVSDTLGHGLESAALAAITTLNNKGFCPARENCEPVLFNYTLPIKFILH